MDDDFDDDENEFVSQKVEKIALNAITAVVGEKEQVVYTKDKVNDWCRQIIDGSIKELVKLEKKFKYVVTCIITQKNGCGLQTAATAFWKGDKDGLIGVQVEAPTFY